MRFREVKKGYTIVEILVAITIIGLLFGIIFIVAGPARHKAKEEKIINDLYQVQNVAERIYLDESSYDKVDFAQSSEIAALKQDIDAQGSNLVINKSSLLYCAYAFLDINPGPDQKAFCVDCKGFAGKINSAFDCSAYKVCYFSVCYDFNCDGKITVDDELLVLGCFATEVPSGLITDCPCPSCPVEYDVFPTGGDNLIDIADALRVQSFVKDPPTSCVASWCDLPCP